MRTLVLAAMLVMLCAACTGADGGAETSPTRSSSTSATPSPTVPPYLAPYSQAERAAYEEAVAAYEDYVGRNNKFLAKGETTLGANRFYRRYSSDWVAAWANLAQLANNNVKVTGAAEVKWVRPVQITIRPESKSVALRRCVDESGLSVLQNGEELRQPDLERPHVYHVTVEMRSDESWWRSGTAERGQSC